MEEEPAQRKTEKRIGNYIIGNIKIKCRENTR